MRRMPDHAPEGACIAVRPVMVCSTASGAMYSIYDVIGWADTPEELRANFPHCTYITRDEYYRLESLPPNIEYAYPQRRLSK